VEKIKRSVRFRYLHLSRKTKRSEQLNKHLPDLENKIYWNGDRHSFAKAGFIGSVCMMLPIPFQMIFASVLAYYFKANIPLATALAWITNPISAIPIWSGGYKVGAWLLDTPSLDSIAHNGITSVEMFLDVLPLIWKPLYLGNLTIGIAIGVTIFLEITFIKPFKQNKEIK